MVFIHYQAYNYGGFIKQGLPCLLKPLEKFLSANNEKHYRRIDLGSRAEETKSQQQGSVNCC